MSAINVNSITGRTGTHGPVLTGVTTVTGGTLNTAALNVTGAASFSDNVSIAGTLSYEDVTDIDSVGVGTFRSGIDVTGGTSAFAGRVNVGANNLNNRALNAINSSTTVGAVSANNHNANGILFQGYNSSVDANNASFVVQSNGSTGIGTAVPGAALHVLNSTYPTATIQRDHAVNYPRLRLSNIANDGADLDGLGDGTGGFRISTLASGNSTERLRIGSAGQIGIGGANYGTSGQVLTSGGASGAVSWTTVSGGGGGSSDKISEGNTEAETVDTGSDGHFKVTTEGTERLRVQKGGNVAIGTTVEDTGAFRTLHMHGDYTRIKLTDQFSGTGNTDGLDIQCSGGSVYHKFYENGSIYFSTNNTNRFQLSHDGNVKILTSGGMLDGNGSLIMSVSGTERLRVGSAGQIGIGGANYGTSGQVLTSGGASGAVSWTTVSGGGGGGGASELDDLSDASTWNNGQGIGIGSDAGRLKGGSKSMGIGFQAMYSSQYANYITAIGYRAGYNCIGSNNTFLGYTAGMSLTTGQNNIIIGRNSASSSNTVSNEITLGDSNITALRCAVTSITSLSDSRDKKDIEDIDAGLDFIKAVRPVKFEWDLRERVDVMDDNDNKIGEEQPRAGLKEYGFVAQELDAVETQFGTEDYSHLVSHNNPDKLEADTYRLFPILVKAVQELAAENAAMKARLDALEGA